MSATREYIPRKCHATNRVVGAKDHASVQFNIAKLNSAGVYTGSYHTVVFSGYVRRRGHADAVLNRLAAQHGLMKDLTTFVGSEKFLAAQAAAAASKK